MFSAVGWPGIFGGLALAFANTGFVLAMSHTTVANTLFTLSAAPLITAVIARVFLREHIAAATVIAIGIAMIGIAIMLGDGLSSGSVVGTLIALWTALCFSLFVIFLRLGKDRNMLPASVIGASIAAVMGLLGSGFDLEYSSRDLGICFFWGAGIVCAVHVMFTAASRYVPSAEIMLITLIEFTLGPFWVWLVFAEKPSSLAMVGGLLVLGAVAGRTVALLAARQRRDIGLN
jgi:drug/metabolite transporter (DMT)-like permease